MDMFILVNSRQDDREISLNIINVSLYESKDLIDPDGSIHKCIIYTLRNGLKIEEEFDSDSDRQNKLDELDTYK